MVRGRSVTNLQQAAMVGEWQKPSRPAGENRPSFSQTLGNSGVGRHAHTFGLSGRQISVCTAYCSPTTIDIRFRQRELEQPKFNYWVPSRLDPRFQRPLSHHSPGRASTLPLRDLEIGIRCEDARQFAWVRTCEPIAAGTCIPQHWTRWRSACCSRSRLVTDLCHQVAELAGSG